MVQVIHIELTCTICYFSVFKNGIQDESVLTELIVDTSSHNVQKFTRNSLLTALVILQIEFAQYFIGIVSRRLHGNHACGMLTCNTVKQCRIEHKMQILGNKMRQNRFHVGFDNEVVVERAHILILFG